jgi:hypothetical protein
VLFATNKIRLGGRRDRASRFIPVPGDFRLFRAAMTPRETFAAIGISRRFFEIYDSAARYQRVFDAGGEATAAVAISMPHCCGLNVTF